MPKSIEAPSFKPSEMLPPGLQGHLRFGELRMLQNAPSAVKMPGHEVQSVYAVYDAYARRLGFAVKASYNGEPGTWFAIDREGEVSGFRAESRAAVLPMLEVMAAARLLASGMSRAEVPA